MRSFHTWHVNWNKPPDRPHISIWAGTNDLTQDHTLSPNTFAHNLTTHLKYLIKTFPQAHISLNQIPPNQPNPGLRTRSHHYQDSSNQQTGPARVPEPRGHLHLAPNPVGQPNMPEPDHVSPKLPTSQHQGHIDSPRQTPDSPPPHLTPLHTR